MGIWPLVPVSLLHIEVHGRSQNTFLHLYLRFFFKISELEEEKEKKKKGKGFKLAAKAAKKLSPKQPRKKLKSRVALMKVFPNELEAQEEFDGFTEWLQTFELYRGKKGVEEFDDDGRIVGKFKVKRI